MCQIVSIFTLTIIVSMGRSPAGYAFHLYCIPSRYDPAEAVQENGVGGEMRSSIVRGEVHFRAAWVALLFLLVAVPLRAQVPTGTILGVVTDSSGASIPNATVTLENVDTGYTRTATTGSDGSYRFPATAVGNYTVRVEATGFRSEARTGLTLSEAQQEVTNLQLAVGTSQQQIEVTAQAPQVNTTTSSLSHLVDPEQIAGLPLNGRNFVDLALLQPGVTQFAEQPISARMPFSENFIAATAPRSDPTCTRSMAQSWGTFRVRALHRFRDSHSVWMPSANTRL